MYKIIHHQNVLQDLYYEIKVPEGPIVLNLNRTDINIGDYIHFIECISYLFFEIPTGSSILTKVVDTKLEDDVYWITVEEV